MLYAAMPHTPSVMFFLGLVPKPVQRKMISLRLALTRLIS